MRIWLLAVSLVLVPAVSHAQADYPNRPITIVVPFPPGGSSDVMTRAVAQKAAESLKTNIVIENRGGGGGVPAALAAKQAAPDGYTLFLGNNGLMAIMPAMGADVRFDPMKDFMPVTTIVSFPSVLMVPVGLPARSVKELVDLSRTKSGGLNYASQGVGSGGHVLAEMLRLQTKAPMTHVPYRGAGPAVTDIAGGNVDMLFGSYVSVAGQVQAGKVRLLGWTSTRRSPAIPDVPTMAEAGYPGIELEIWHGIFAPAGTPTATVGKLNDAFVKALGTAEIRQMFGKQAADAVPSSPDAFAKLLAADIDRLGKVVRAAGIKMQ